MFPAESAHHPTHSTHKWWKGHYFSRRLLTSPRVNVDGATPKRWLCKELWWSNTWELCHRPREQLTTWPDKRIQQGKKRSCHVGEGVLGNKTHAAAAVEILKVNWKNSLQPRYHHRSQKLHKDAKHNSAKDRAHGSHGSFGLLDFSGKPKTQRAGRDLP